MKKKRNTRRKLLFVIILSLFVLICGGLLVYAAANINDEKENDFRIGNLETKVEEVFTKPVTPLIPKNNTWVEKKVGVKNTGTMNQFVRVMVFPEIRVEEKENYVLLSSNIGHDVKVANGSKVEQIPSTWRKGEDGYYYYLKALEPGTSTKDNLFEFVRLESGQDSRFNNAKFIITIKVEAINCVAEAYRQAWWNGQSPANGELKTIDEELFKQIEKK
ncbi:hypothetical protein [Candidatus Enterococcus ferrettii]|uniref:Alternate signal-mediated exported protein, CPF_0494 family n=1 Tax=Candidatus Enterococcus ferrettii TaxID=2815324 RepID=A0ABV0EXQ2_9ENTE|nr:hypothetical protein [Enterococcus sp. 665A]MBO1342883.1 hypothetical protein [Enterococcus sp. 665A]